MINLNYNEEKETVSVDMDGEDFALLAEIGAGVTSMADLMMKATGEDIEPVVSTMFRYFCGIMKDGGYDVSASNIGMMMVLRENPVTEEEMAKSRETVGDD